MIVTGFAHLIGHFTSPALDSPEKEKLFDLMNTVQFRLDRWFDRSTMDLFNCFSLFMSVLIITLGAVCVVIINNDLPNKVVKKLALINTIGMVSMLLLSMVYAFSIPIALFLICSILMFLSNVKS